MYVFTFPVDLVGSLHDSVEFLQCNGHQPWMSYPCAIMAIAGLTFFICPHACDRLFVRLCIVLDRNLGRHTANRMSIAPVASFNGEQRVGAHKVSCKSYM